MRQSSLSDLRCPECNRELSLQVHRSVGSEIIEGNLICPSGRNFPIQNGVPNLIYQDKLLPSDQEFQQKYDEGAQEYERGMEWLFNSFYEDQDSVRNQMAELLELRPNAHVLDVGSGTGKDSRHISHYLNRGGRLYAIDLSSGMIEIAKKNLASLHIPVEYFLGNGSYLPFADRIFDGLFHFGGLNEFGDISRALREMTRVVRIGGKVVVGDEGVSPWLRRKVYGRILVKANPLYKHRPPLSAIPSNAEKVCLRWILGNAFYVIDYRVGVQPPRLNLDLPIPGKRGGTLRSRYYGSKS